METPVVAGTPLTQCPSNSSTPSSSLDTVKTQKIQKRLDASFTAAISAAATTLTALRRSPSEAADTAQPSRVFKSQARSPILPRNSTSQSYNCLMTAVAAHSTSAETRRLSVGDDVERSLDEGRGAPKTRLSSYKEALVSEKFCVDSSGLLRTEIPPQSAAKASTCQSEAITARHLDDDGILSDNLNFNLIGAGRPCIGIVESSGGVGSDSRGTQAELAALTTMVCATAAPGVDLSYVISGSAAANCASAPGQDGLGITQCDGPGVSDRRESVSGEGGVESIRQAHWPVASKESAAGLEADENFASGGYSSSQNVEVNDGSEGNEHESRDAAHWRGIFAQSFSADG
jgi:hypothetical protein